MNSLEQTLQKIFPQASQVRIAAASRLDQLALPHLVLGDLMDLAVELAGMTGTVKPQFSRKAIVCMAGDHGTTAEGFSESPPEHTQQLVQVFVDGGTGVNALAKQAGADVFVVDMGVNADFAALITAGRIIDKKVGHGSNDITRGPAMSIARARQAVEAGIDVAASLCQDYDLLGTGGIGVGGTISSTAIATVVSGKPVEHLLVGDGGGEDDQLVAKTGTIKKILEVNKPDRKNGIDILAKLGGFEIGGIAGLIIGAASCRVPVIVDGFISTAGALIAYKIEPFIRDYLICAHRPVEPGHKFMQEVLGCKKPLLDLDMRRGLGNGAAVAMNIVDAAAAVLADRATGEKEAVSGADE